MQGAAVTFKQRSANPMPHGRRTSAGVEGWMSDRWLCFGSHSGAWLPRAAATCRRRAGTSSEVPDRFCRAPGTGRGVHMVRPGRAHPGSQSHSSSAGGKSYARAARQNGEKVFTQKTRRTTTHRPVQLQLLPAPQRQREAVAQELLAPAAAAPQALGRRQQLCGRGGRMGGRLGSMLQGRQCDLQKRKRPQAKAGPGVRRAPPTHHLPCPATHPPRMMDTTQSSSLCSASSATRPCTTRAPPCSARACAGGSRGKVGPERRLGAARLRMQERVTRTAAGCAWPAPIPFPSAHRQLPKVGLQALGHVAGQVPNHLAAARVGALLGEGQRGGVRERRHVSWTERREGCGQRGTGASPATCATNSLLPPSFPPSPTHAHTPPHTLSSVSSASVLQPLGDCASTFALSASW